MARAHVDPLREREYRDAVTALAGQLGARGMHLWLFRSRDDAHLFLEFAEGPAGSPHRGERDDPAERAIEERLRGLAAYDAAADALWDDVTLTGEEDHGSTGR